MVTVPSFLLRQLYVKGSLKNTPDGFQFELMNRLGSGYARKVFPLSVDGVDAPIADSEFELNGKVIRFEDVSQRDTLSLAINKAITVRVSGVRLEPGARKIGLGFEVPGLGELEFDFTDTVSPDDPDGNDGSG